VCCRGLNAFIGLLTCTEDEAVRVWILRVLGDMLNCLNEDKVKLLAHQ
jgi:hypothetical protein